MIGMNGEEFTFLHNHTAEGSLLDSILPVKRLVEKAKELGHKAVGLTNHGKMHDYVTFYKYCKSADIKPIIGCEIYEIKDVKEYATTKERYHLVLLAKNKLGLQNLFKISTDGHKNFFYYKPLMDINYIKENNLGEGIICLTACQIGRISKGLTNGEDMTEYYNQLVSTFDNVYLEIQSHDTEEQKIANQKIVEFSKKVGGKIVITTDSHMENKDDQIVHDIFVEISQDREVGEGYSGCYLQTIDEIHEIMDLQVGKSIVDIGIKNSMEISNMVEWYDIGIGQPNQMPIVTKHMPKVFNNTKQWYLHLIEEGFKERGHHLKDSEFQKIRKERLDMEFPILEELEYLDYFIMLYLLLNEARKREIPLGFARGSSAGSLSAYYLGITDIDSVTWDLDFTRFCNLGRKNSMADVDLDISKKYRKELVNISKEMFGEEYVAPIATFNTMSTKVAIRDVGSVLDRRGIYDLPYNVRNEVAGAIPTIKTIDDLGEDIEKEVLLKDLMSTNSRLESYYEKYPLWFEYVMKLEGLPKSLGQHAAGTILSPRPLVEYCPLCLNKDKELMLQIEMHNAMDDLKLIKMDFLGLKTLDVINDTLGLLGKKWSDFKVDDIDFYDKEVYDSIYRKGNTTGIFQMESFEAKNMCVGCNTDSIDDIIAINAFNRPGTKDNFPIYIKNKEFPDKVEVVHDDLRDIFDKTHFVLLYQEQALSLFRHAGFPEDRVDNARRAIGHKEESTMKALKEDFEIGLKNKGWNQKQIDEVWLLMMKQADYSFNKSHSCSYGILSYATAWYKFHYPSEFFASALNNEDDNGKVSKLIDNAKKMGINIKRPNINKSSKNFIPLNNKDKKDVLFGFGALKGLGDASIKSLMENRPYTGFVDFMERSGLNISNKIVLAKCGALGKPIDVFNDIMKYEFENNYKKFTPRKSVSPKDLKDKFNIEIPNSVENFKEKRIESFNNLLFEEYKKQRILDKRKFEENFKEKYYTDPQNWEFETMSMFITHNPFEESLTIIEDYDEIEMGNAVTIVGIITKVTKKKSKKNGKIYAFVDFYNGVRNIEITFWANEFSKYANGIKVGSKMAVFGKKEINGVIVIEAKPYRKWLNEKMK